MGPKHITLFLLAIGTIVATTVSVTLNNREPVLIPTLNLQGSVIAPSGLFGALVNDVNGIRLTQYNATEAAAGIVLNADEHNMFRCAQGGPVLSASMQSDAVTRFWGYEYSGNERANRAAGKIGRELFDGEFFISQGQINESPGLYDYLNTLAGIENNKDYYFMLERDLGYSCATGILGISTCGNGVVESGEQCDDNNTVNGDGCTSYCQLEPGSSSSSSAQAPASTVFIAHLDDSQNTSPTGSTATGNGYFVFNAQTNALTYDISYSGLGSPVILGHIHGPAARGVDAGIAINLNPGSSTSARLTGSTVLTASQIADLFSGLWYVNIHTQAYGAGEIRGQIEQLMSGSSSSAGTGTGSSSMSSFAACPYGFSCNSVNGCQAGTMIGSCAAAAMCCVQGSASSSSATFVSSATGTGSSSSFGQSSSSTGSASSSQNSSGSSASSIPSSVGLTLIHRATTPADTAYAGQTNVPLMRFEASAINAPMKITNLIVSRLNNFTLSNAQNFSLHIDTDDDDVVDSVLLQNVQPTAGLAVQFTIPANIATSIPQGASVTAEIHADISPTLTGVNPVLKIGFFTGAVFVSAEHAVTGSPLQGIQYANPQGALRSIDSECVPNVNCQISVVISDSTAYSLNSNPISSSSSLSSATGSGSSSLSSSAGSGSSSMGNSSSSLNPSANCGNGTPESGEECDDGNINNTDACVIDVAQSYECKAAVCGDGYLWNTGGGTEECDDGNTLDGDGCFSNCTLMIPPDA